MVKIASVFPESGRRVLRRTGWVLIEGERGQAMLTFLVIMFVVSTLAVASLELLNLRQLTVGHNYRKMAARYLAEAGVERVLGALETGPESVQSLVGSSEELTKGKVRGSFIIEAIQRETDGSFRVLSEGRFAGEHDRVEAIVKLVPHILTYALFAQRLIQVEGATSRLYLIPPSSACGCGDEGALGSNGEVWLMTRGIAVNAFSGTTLQLREGDLPDHALLGVESTARSGQCGGHLGKVILAGNARLTFGEDHRDAPDYRWLQGAGVMLNMDISSTPQSESFPLIDRGTLRGLAATNTANIALNEAAGVQKSDSVYDPKEFLYILSYVANDPSEMLKGPIYVTGPVVVSAGASARLVDGFLAVEGSLTLQIGGRLEVRHTPQFGRFPGIMTIGDSGALVVQQRGVLIVDGLVYAERIIDAEEGSVIDVRGAIVAGDPYLSVHNHNATLVVRYNPSVTTMLGVLPQTKGRTDARVALWAEGP